MEFEALQVGLVVQADWDSRPFRILAFDQTEILYDCWWPDVGRWGLQDLLGKAYYYRTATRLILERAAALRVDALTGDEHSVHRPDLPLRLLRFSELEWGNLFTSSIDAFSSRVASAAPNISLANSDVALDVAVVALAPYGSKGGMKKPVLVTAENGRHFSSRELLWRAASIQAPIDSNLRHGVGMYRLGFAARRPLFYLWGFLDQAGLLARSGVE
jgi:hypothetical protein